jgi:ClpP class serine protease
LSQRARATIQTDVDRLYAEFCGLVAANRGLTAETVRATNAAVYRGELAVRAGLADRVGTLDAAIADMAAEFDRAAMPAQNVITATNPKRSPSMATNETERNEHDTGEPERALAAEAAPPAPQSEPAPSPLQAPAAQPTPEPVTGSDPAERLREEYAEIAGLAAQAIRLGVSVDAADAMRRGVSAADLRRSILNTLAARAEASSVIAAAPSTPVTGDSPIVRRAKQRAVAAQA